MISISNIPTSYMTAMSVKDVHQIYSKGLLVSFRNGELLERRSRLVVTIELHSFGTSLKKELVVRLTEEENLLFLYMLTLSEDDFRSLKVQQGLLVDFIAFPQRFIDLLEQCSQDELKDTPKFVLQLSQNVNSNMASLDIIETNPFKHLVHLSLKLIQGSDDDVKKHLAHCLKSLQESKNKVDYLLKATEGDLRQRLHQKEEMISRQTVELDNLRLELQRQISMLNCQHTQQLSHEKEKAVQTMSDLTVKHERQLRDVENANNREIQRLEAQISMLETQNKNLETETLSLESNNQSLRPRLKRTEEELRLLQDSMKNLKFEKEAIANKNKKLEEELHSMNKEYAKIQQELREKEVAVIRHKSTMEILQSQKNSVDEQVREKNEVISKLQKENEILINDCKKADEIIHKTRSEYSASLVKLKESNNIAYKLHNEVEEKDNKIKKLQEAASDFKDIKMQKEQQIMKLQSELEDANKKLDDNRKKMECDAGIISRLSRKLSDQEAVDQVGINRFRYSAVQQAGLSMVPSMSSGNQQRMFGSPIAMSTPQVISPNAGYLSNGLYAPPKTNFPIDVNTRINSNKENAKPLDPKYLQPNDDMNGQKYMRFLPKPTGIKEVQSKSQLPRRLDKKETLAPNAEHALPQMLQTQEFGI